MPQNRQQIQGSRPRRQRCATGDVVIREEDIQRFLTDYEKPNHTTGTVQFFRRNLRQFYNDLPADETIRYGALQK